MSGRRYGVFAASLAFVLSSAACTTAFPRRAPSKAARAGFMQCPISARATMDGLLNQVRDCMLLSRTGWLQGAGWSETILGSVPIGDNPLDHVETTGPIALLSDDGRAYWVNHVGLELAGITSGTEDPPGGRIGRLPGGREPNGVLYDRAMEYIDRLIPELHP